MKKDLQRSKVYAWERQVVSPHDKTPVPLKQVEAIVRHVWIAEGLQHPPLVRLKRGKRLGQATRTCIWLHDPTYNWVILHELAHAMARTHDGLTNKHGALFMGMFVKLVHKYIGLDLDMLVRTAEDMGLRVTLEATPVFLKDHRP